MNEIKETIANYGGGVLKDNELVSLVFGVSSEKAQTLLDNLGGLRGLVGEGFGLSKSIYCKVTAFNEILKRLTSSTVKNRPIIKSPGDVFELMGKMKFYDREHMKVLYLNTKHHVINEETIAVGTLDSCAVHPREIFKNAIKQSVAAIILVHNHPSGDPSASREDIDFTRRLVEAGNVIGIKVLDHIVIGDGVYKSLVEEGLL